MYKNEGGKKNSTWQNVMQANEARRDEEKTQQHRMNDERQRTTPNGSEIKVRLKKKQSTNKQTNIKRDGKPNKVVCQNVKIATTTTKCVCRGKRGQKTKSRLPSENEKGNDLKDSVKPLRIDRHMYLCPRYS